MFSLPSISNAYMPKSTNAKYVCQSILTHTAALLHVTALSYMRFMKELVLGMCLDRMTHVSSKPILDAYKLISWP